MKVVLSTVGRFHMFALARELELRSQLECVFTGFPWSALAREGLPRNRVRTFPFVRPLLMLGVKSGWLNSGVADRIHELSLLAQDAYVRHALPACDIFVGHEGVGLKTGAAAQARGAVYVCDRGCTHMGWREALLEEEYDRVGIAYPGRPRTYDREIAEYEKADLVVVPSSFARRSFEQSGIGAAKLAVVPYGVDTSHFSPISRAPRKEFRVLFVGGLSVRKGAHDLFAAYDLIEHPQKRLVIAGTISKDIADNFREYLNRDTVTVSGPVPHLELRNLMGSSDVLVLPSIEDGFGMVLAEALASGCPIVSTTNSGAPDLIDDGVEGFVVPIRSPEIIADRMQRLADCVDLRRSMSEAAAKRMLQIGGWHEYGNAMIAVYRQVLAARHL